MTPTPTGSAPDGAPNAPAVDVSVVVVTYNSAHLLEEFVAALDTGMAGVRHELVVVDNDSHDGSLATALRLRPDTVAVQTGRNAGYAAGINAGVGAASPSRAVLVLNPDVRLGPGCAAVLLEHVSREGVAIAAPRLLNGDGTLHHSIRREPTIARAWADAVVGATRAGRHGTWGEVVTDDDAYERTATVDWLEGSTLMISRAAWDVIGPWDESFFLYSEETDYALRARDLGLAVVYTPQAQAVHLQGGSAGSVHLWPLLTLNKWRLHRKRHGAASSALYWAALVVREAGRAALGRPESRIAVRDLLSPARLHEPPGPQSVR